MEDTYSIKTSDFVNVSISTSCTTNIPTEKRFQKGLQILNLKGKLELLTGANSSTMTISVFDKEDKMVCALDNDEALLGSYPIEDGMRLHVHDSFLLRKQIDEDGTVEKFELSMEEYSKRPDSVLAYLKKNKLGKFNEEEMEKREALMKKEEELEEAKLNSIQIGNRCEVKVPAQPVRRAVVMFKGKVSFKPGFWIGVKYDEPFGKNDGSVEGVRYFECSPKYGGFVKPAHVEVGDFPEEEFNFDDEL